MARNKKQSAPIDPAVLDARERARRELIELIGKNARARSDAERKQAVRRQASDAGMFHAPEDQARREACRFDLSKFLVTYLPESFPKPFSADHLRVIAKIQEAILRGGRFVEALYRGSGKTTIVEGAAIWALLYGHRRYVVVVSADSPAAKRIISSIKIEFEANDLLDADFNEVTHYVKLLEGHPQRCAYQHVGDQPTRISWVGEKLVFPTVPGSSVGGSIFESRGITASIRGMKHKADGLKPIRPDFVIIDDPQTHESARSSVQVQDRLEIIQRDILTLAGHHAQPIAAVCCCTVIAPDDVADQLLSPDKNIGWIKERVKMLQAPAKNENLWLNEYAEIRRNFRQDVPGDQHRAAAEATEFYKARRAEMDEGAVVSWSECYDETEISGVQHAYNCLIDHGRDVFQAEYQNEPVDDLADDGILSAAEICNRLSGLERGIAPLDTQTVTAFIDVQDKILYWLVAAWAHDFTGAVIDYGTWPRQPGGNLVDVRKTLQAATGATDREGAWYQGLTELVGELTGREWRSESQTMYRIARLMIDANYGESTPVVYAFCRKHQMANILLPSHGRGITHNQKPISMFARKPGEQRGLEWRITRSEKHAARHVLYDTNFWKSFVHGRLATQVGSRGGLSLFGNKPEAHSGIAQQITAEVREKRSGDGRECWEWRERPDRRANHLLDCLVGSAVAASIMGVSPPGIARAKPTRRPTGPPKIIQNSNRKLRTKY